jgi:hypothetical protein
MPDDEKLSPADPSDIADSIAFALLFSGRKRVHDSDKYTAAIAANRIVRHLERAGFVVMKKPPAPGGGEGRSYIGCVATISVSAEALALERRVNCFYWQKKSPFANWTGQKAILFVEGN